MNVKQEQALIYSHLQLDLTIGQWARYTPISSINTFVRHMFLRDLVCVPVIPTRIIYTDNNVCMSSQLKFVCVKAQEHHVSKQR